MKYLFFMNTPAHVHMYKNVVRRLSDDGHDVKILARDYGCTLDLLDSYDFEHEIYGKCETKKYSLVRELPFHYLNIFRMTRNFDPDLIFGIGAYAAHAGAITRTPVITIHDSEPTSLDHKISMPFINALLTPDAFEKDLGSKHHTFNGFKETAYLYPGLFDPSTDNIKEELGVARDEEYVILRFNAFGSHHDVGRSGFSLSDKNELISTLNEYATVFVSDEGGQLDFEQINAHSFELHPAKMHDALAGAALLVADTQTMVTEAALLGTPAIRSNSFVGESDMGNFKELEANGLIHNERTLEDVLDRATEILADSSAKETWQKRREAYLDDKVNLTQLVVDIATEFERTGGDVERAVTAREVLV